MKARPTVFISAVSHELGSFRRAVEGIVRRRGCFADSQEATFVPDAVTVEHMLRRRLSEADAVIHIVGFRFGSAPADASTQLPHRSYTQMEFHLALELQIPVYRFLTRSPDVRDRPAAEEAAETEVQQAAQLAHRRSLEAADHLYGVFDSVEDLCRLVGDIPLLGARGQKVDVSRLTPHDGSELVGRQAELQRLDDAWQRCRADARPRAHVLTVIAMGGEGKTSLVSHWLASMAAAGWPGCETVFAWSFYSQGTREDVSSDLFLQEALHFFGGPLASQGATGPYEKGRLLAELMSGYRALLVLDGVEPLQQGPTSAVAGEMKDAGLVALLRGLATHSRGLCIITTRHPIADLRPFSGQSSQDLTLGPLGDEGGQALLRSLGAKGSASELSAVVRELGGHALSLALLGSYLRDAYGGDVRQRNRVRLPDIDERLSHGHAARIIETYLRWLDAEPVRPWWSRWPPRWLRVQPSDGTQALGLLNAMALFDRAAETRCLDALLQPPSIKGLTDRAAPPGSPAFNIAVQRLTEARLLWARRDTSGTIVELDAHPLLRDHMARRIERMQPRMARQGHRRLFEFFHQSAPDVPAPTLRELEPLYRAIFHGCRGGRHREAFESVYLRRILRWPESYPTRNLGAHGSDLSALANFFVEPWSRLVPGLDRDDEAWLFGLAGARLRATSRLHEARMPMQAGLRIHRDLQEWSNAGTAAGNLSELALVSGDVAGAITHGAEAIRLADQGSDLYMRIGVRTTLADAYAKAGHLEESARLFTDAEGRQAVLQPSTPLLYGIPGFRFCDFLLSGAEQVAWRVAYAFDDAPAADMHAAAIQVVRRTMRRALTLYEWRRDEDPLLETALLQLTMGRAAFLNACLHRRPLMRFRAQLDQAASGLRRAGVLEYLPTALVARACMTHWEGGSRAQDAAVIDLDEAWDISTRGPMPLQQVDILLARCRLFSRVPDYPWHSPHQDLAAAVDLLHGVGYRRRAAELCDLRRQLGGMEEAGIPVQPTEAPVPAPPQALPLAP